MTTHSLPLNMQRRLISARELSGKIGHAYDWVIRNWKNLSAQRGFPEPVLGGGVGKHLRWDERAIDLWLDAQMPQVLQKVAGAEQIAADPIEIRETQTILQRRAQEMSL